MKLLRYFHLKNPAYRLILALLIFLSLYILQSSAKFQTFETRFFDWLSTADPPAPLNSPVILVGIDEPSFRELGMQWPWDRKIHAALIEKLTNAGASVIAMDIVFTEPSIPESDQIFAEAIQAAPPVVLAAEEVVEETDYISQMIRIEPMTIFSEAGALSGVAAFPMSKDGIIRRMPVRDDGFATVALKQWMLKNGLPVPRSLDGSTYIQYFGPSRSYPYVSYYQALDPDRFLPEGIFDNRLVIIGLALKSSPKPDRKQTDLFMTPFTWSDGRLMAGIEIHATILDNLRLNHWIKPVSDSCVMIGLVILLGLLYILFHQWRLKRGAVISVVLISAVIATSYFLLRYGHMWIPPALFLIAIFLSFTGESALAFLKEQSGRRYIKQAFGRYLSPELVEQLAKDPSRLNLGGETRYMTIMFCDIRNFTTLSERFSKDTEGLVHVINLFFSAMTDVIMKHGGTVDKYIGDCIMAFWNAPIDDPDHAVHACAAALEMIEELTKINAEISKEMPGDNRNNNLLDIGIGLNTGRCVVGNIGSVQRVNYSVLGDSVNLASRLEGQTKNYGTRIVIGKETAAAADKHFAVLELDLIAVKGKTEAMNVFTVIEDLNPTNHAKHQKLTARHQQMLKRYRNKDWSSAKIALSECRTLAPDLSRLYDLYDQRISEFGKNPPREDWTGVYAAETK